MLPAFRHAVTAGAGAREAQLEVTLWDRASTGGRPAPTVPWALGDVRGRGDVRGFEGPDLAIFTDPDSGAITVLDHEAREIFYWVADPTAVPWHERGAPLRSALHQWAASEGGHFVHAGAVGIGGAAVLLAGASGAGKSTTALACLEAGFDYAGDDYVILTEDEAIRAHCLYSTAKLDAAALDRLPSLVDAAMEAPGHPELKVLLDVAEHRREQVKRSLRVDAIVLPSFAPGSGPPVARPATRAEALRALAPTSLLQLPGAAHARMRAMARLVRSVPVFALEIGSDIAKVSSAVAALCAELAPARPVSERGAG
jgi:hypothetical protein